jgi:hypothetical protein
VYLSGGSGFDVGSTPMVLVDVAASVPTTAPYFNKAVLDMEIAYVNVALVTGVSGVDEAAYYGDVSGEESLNALDASLVDQVGAGAGTGFSAFKDLDPSIIGGVGGGEYVNALDASLINQQSGGMTIPSIPQVPTGVPPVLGGPDPYLYFGSLQAGPGQTATVTLYLDVTDPRGVPLAALEEAIGFDPTLLQISNIRGTKALGSFSTVGTADNQSGVLIVSQAFAGMGLPAVLPYGTDIAVLQFDVTVNADASFGSVSTLTLLQEGIVNGQYAFTAISDDEGALTFTAGKAPTNAGNPAIDGTLTVATAQPVVSPVAQLPVVVNSVKHAPVVVRSVRKVAVTTGSQGPEEVSAVTTSDMAPMVVTSGEAGPGLVADLSTIPAARSVVFAAVAPELSSNSAVQVAGTVTAAAVSGNTPTGASSVDVAALIATLLDTHDVVALPSDDAVVASSPTQALDEVYQQLPEAPVAVQSPGGPASGSRDVDDSLLWLQDAALVELDVTKKPALGKNAGDKG